MSGSQWLSVAGLTLTLVGAAILSLRDLRGGRPTTWNEAARGFPRVEARLGFPLIAIGSALQIIGVIAA